MSALPQRCRLLVAALLLAAGPGLRAAESTPATAEIKRITDRYTLTKTRITTLLDRRLHPVPLPANPPNPFYQAPKDQLPSPDSTLTHGAAEETVVPETADASDADVLKRYANSLKITGVIMLGGSPHLTINNTPSKVGDVIPVGSKERPVYLKIIGITPGEVTLGLNEATFALPLKK